MFTADLKDIDWSKVDLTKNDKRRHGYRKDCVWLHKSPIKKKWGGLQTYRRTVGISRNLLDEVGFEPGTELILLRHKDIFAFKKVNSHGQFKINAQHQIQNQPLYLELNGKTGANNMFDAFVHEGMIAFYAHKETEEKDER